jgi:erythromycin esterase
MSRPASIDKVIASLDESVELLGFGEALHGGKDILILRNRIFQHLVEAHGYSAIAIENASILFLVKMPIGRTLLR